MSLSAAIARAASRVRIDRSLMLLDVVFTVVAYLSVLVLRFDGDVPADYWSRFLKFVPVAVLAHLVSCWGWGLYRQMWRHASVDEARKVVEAGASAGVALVIGALFTAQRVPMSVVVLGTVVATMLIGALRFQSRLFAFQRGESGQSGLRVVLVGAGEAGAAIVREMRRSDVGLTPIAVIDDDPHKLGLRLLGVPVVGPVDTLSEWVDRTNAHQVVLAIPSADQELVRRVARGAEAASVPLKVLPRASDLLTGRPSVRDMRALSIEDMVGRQEVQTDLAGVSSLLAGCSVLITGAGGSVGSEIARQVARFEPSHLTLLDHDETHLFEVAEMLPAGTIQVLADVRDQDRMHQVMLDVRPDVVFHAAAHKHVPLLEDHACEAVWTNVLGTRNVMAAAASAGVERLVLISTDKAVRPSSVMGASKWLCEQLMLNLAPEGSRWCAVRFGNVMGSRGSVIPVFERQIAAGGPVTVTDPEMTRYFMSVHEAVQLVLQATLLAGGDVFELKMGEPVNILDLAKRMIRLSGQAVGTDVPVQIVGRRPGEKLIEELHSPDEDLQPTVHPSIVQISPRTLLRETLDASLLRLAAFAGEGRDADAAQFLLALPSSTIDVDVDDEPTSVDLTADDRATGAAGWTLSTT